MPQTTLVLVPHPDDAEFFAGGTIARMVKEGRRVVIVVATDGGKGSFEHTTEALVQVRRREAMRAASILGAEPPVMLGHPDMGLEQLPPGALRQEFIRAIRQYRPDALIAEDPFSPGDWHPDHRAVAWAATEAVNAAGLPLVHPEHRDEGLEPHQVAEKYFYAESDAGVNKVVDITATLETKLAALAAHESQMAFLVEGVLRQMRLAGVDPRPLLEAAGADPAALVGLAVRAQAAAAGQRIGVPFGEPFRYERFHPLVEALLAGS